MGVKSSPGGVKRIKPRWRWWARAVRVRPGSVVNPRGCSGQSKGFCGQCGITGEWRLRGIEIWHRELGGKESPEFGRRWGTLDGMGATVR